MAAGAPGFRNSLVQEIFWTRTGLLLLILLVISGGALGVSSTVDTGTVKSVLFSVGTGTLITAVVSFGQTVLTANAAHRAMLAPIVAATQEALRQAATEQRTLHREYMPSHEFDAGNEPDPAFNRLMMADLHAARQYFFRGFSGRHAATRLLLSHAEWELRVIIADPLCHTAIAARARYLERRAGQTVETEAVEDRLREEIYIGLVGLFLARSRCSHIDLTVVDDPPVNRMEMFDQSVWLTLFTDPAGAGMLYPRTLRFTEQSFLYGAHRAEFLQTCNSRAAKHYRITSETSRPEFLALFKRITGATLTDNGLRALTRKFRDFERDFTLAARLRQPAGSYAARRN